MGGLIKSDSYFSDSEFHGFEDKLDPKLRPALERWRVLWGKPIRVTPLAAGVGRYIGDSHSQHNIEKWGVTRAVDVFPEGINTYQDALRAIATAEAAGFKGIGIYPDAKPSFMMHVDVRPQERVSTWGRMNGDYISLAEGLKAWRVLAA